MNIVLIIILTLLAAFVGTITGFGTSTIMVPVLSFFLPLPETLLFVGIIHWFGNIWKVVFFKKGINLKLALLFGIPGLVISFFAAKLPTILNASLLKQGLGLFLVVYSILLFARPKWKIKASSRSAIIGGSLTGLISGIFGVGGAIRTAFLSAFNLKKATFIFTSGLIGIMIDSSRLLQYLISDTRINSIWLSYLIVCIPTSLVGAYTAKKFVDKVSQNKFRTVVIVGLLIIGFRYLFLGEIYL
jgi:hypothetical protein